jgi:hypothetical protein
MHDFHLDEFNWNLRTKTLVLAISYPHPPNEKSSEIVFENVIAWNLKDAVEGCIIFDIEEFSINEYLSEDQKYLTEQKNYCYTPAINKIENSKLKAFQLNSSYGLHGFIIAQSYANS